MRDEVKLRQVMELTMYSEVPQNVLVVALSLVSLASPKSVIAI